MSAQDHLTHVRVEEALAADCFYGECEHVDENGIPDDFSTCPPITMDVCLDCMDGRGEGRDPSRWEDSLVGWPCKPEHRIQVGPEPEPAIFKPSPEESL